MRATGISTGRAELTSWFRLIFVLLITGAVTCLITFALARLRG